jgi:hypothetical protein
MLRQYGRLTQRDAVVKLGVRTGVAVSGQLRKLAQLLASDATLRTTVTQIEKRLDRKQSSQAC